MNILYEKNVTSGTTTITKHFYAGGLQVAKMAGSAGYYLHQDALGNTRLVATTSVTIKFSSNYVPYGNNYAVSGKEVFMYTGKPFDSATGLYYYGARYYDPATGRFIAQDSYAGKRTDPMTMNLYIYARDNPEKMVDPNGHMFLASATMIDGIIARKWLAPRLASSTTTDYTDVNKVSHTPSPVVTILGSSSKSVDVTLTTNGVNQYEKPPKTGVGGPTDASLLISNDSYQTGLRLAHFGVGIGLTGLGLAEMAVAVVLAFDPEKPPSNPAVKGGIITDAFLTGAALIVYGGWNIAQAFSPQPSKSFTGGTCFFGVCL